MTKGQWYLADNGTAIDEYGFDTIDELIEYYDYDGRPQKIEAVLIDENNEVVDSGYYNTKTLL